MLTFKQAKQLILDNFSKNPNQSPMEDWVIYHSACCEYSDYYYITGNSRGYLEYDKPEYCLVGANGFLVHKINQNIIHLSNSMSPKQYINDIQDEQNANGKYYVLQYVLPENPNEHKTDLLKLKKLFSCHYTQAKALQRQPFWLSTRLTTLQIISQELSDKGINNQIVLLDTLYDHTIYWQYHCGEYNLKQLSNLIDDIKEKLEVI